MRYYLYGIDSLTKQVELFIPQIKIIYLTNLILNSNSTHLIHKLYSTNQLSNRGLNRFGSLSALHVMNSSCPVRYRSIMILTRK